MRLELTGRHVDITPGLRRLVEGRLARLERMLNATALSAQAVLTREKRQHRADITLHTRGEKFLHGFGAAADWDAALTGAVEKLTQQAQRLKGKWKDRKRQPAKGVASEALTETAPAAPVEREAAAPSARRKRARVPHVVQTVRRTVKPMTVAAAMEELEALGDAVVIFRDAGSGSVNVLYRHKGELTLVETEA
jgi:ribosomal subunit interface protein